MTLPDPVQPGDLFRWCDAEYVALPNDDVHPVPLSAVRDYEQQIATTTPMHHSAIEILARAHYDNTELTHAPLTPQQAFALRELLDYLEHIQFCGGRWDIAKATLREILTTRTVVPHAHSERTLAEVAS